MSIRPRVKRRLSHSGPAQSLRFSSLTYPFTVPEKPQANVPIRLRYDMYQLS